MAIEPFRRGVGVPSISGGRGAARVQGAGTPLPSAIEALRGQMMTAAEPYLRQQAEDQAIADFAADGIGKTPEGEYIRPEPRGGGLIYQQAYENAANAQYMREISNDTEMDLANLYLDPNNRTKTPEQLLEMSQAIVEGRIAGTPVEIRGEMFEQLTRQMRQRHIGYQTQYFNDQMNQLARGLESEQSRLMDEFQNAAELGNTPEATATMQSLGTRLNSVMKDRIAMRFANDEDYNALRVGMANAMASGAAMFDVRQWLPEASSTEVQDLLDMLDGTAPDWMTVMGRDRSQWFAALPSPEARQYVTSRIAGMVSRKARLEEEAQLDTDMSMAFSMLTPGTGFGAETSPKDAREMARWWAAQNGLDPMTSNGMVEIYNQFGELPEGLYERQFKNVSTKGIDQIEASMSLYEQARALPGPNGEQFDISPTLFTNPRDEAFMMHYRNMRDGKMEPIEAHRFAQEAINQDIPTTRSAQETLFRERMGLEDEAALFDFMSDELDLDYSTLTPEARDWVMGHAAVLSALAPPENVMESTVAAFRQTWVQNPTDLNYAMQRGNQSLLDPFKVRNDSSMDYVRRDEAPPQVEGLHSQRFMGEIASRAIDSLMGENQLPGLPPREEMQFGRNVFTRHIMNGPDGSRVFGLFYENQSDGIITPIPLKDANGANLLIDVGRAASVANTQISAFNTARAESERNLQRLELETMDGSRNRSEYEEAAALHEQLYGGENLLETGARASVGGIAGLANTVSGFFGGGDVFDPEAGNMGRGWHRSLEITPDMFAAPPALRFAQGRDRSSNAYTGAAADIAPVESKARDMFYYLTRTSRFSPEMASSILGNLMQESGLNERAINAGDGSDGSDSVGLAQWNGERARNFQERMGVSLGESTWQQQLDFLTWELRNGTHIRARRAAEGSSSFQNMVRAITDHYERPHRDHAAHDRRLGYAETFYGLFGDR